MYSSFNFLLANAFVFSEKPKLVQSLLFLPFYWLYTKGQQIQFTE